MKEWCDICKNNTSDTCIHCTNNDIGCPPTLWVRKCNYRSKVIANWAYLYDSMNEAQKIFNTPVEKINTDEFRKWINNMEVLKENFNICYEETFKYLLKNRR